MSSVPSFVACATSSCCSVRSVSEGPRSCPGDRVGGLWSILSRSSQWLTELVSLNPSELRRDLLKIFWPVKCLKNMVPMKAANIKCRTCNFSFKENTWILQLQRNEIQFGCWLVPKTQTRTYSYVHKAPALMLSCVNRNCWNSAEHRAARGLSEVIRG